MELSQENGLHMPSHSSLSELVTQQEQTASLQDSQQSFVHHQMLPQPQSIQQIGIHNTMHIQPIGQMQDHFQTQLAHGISSAYEQMDQPHTMEVPVNGNIHNNENDSIGEDMNSKKKRKRTDKKEKGDPESSNKKIGRKIIPYSQAKNKRDKLKKLDEKICELAGGEEEKKIIMQAYRESSYGKDLFPELNKEVDAHKVVQNVVQLIHSLPPMSPLRQPLIQAIGKDIQPSALQKLLNVSERTVFRSRKLDLEDSILYTLRYKPEVRREKRHHNNNALGGLSQSVLSDLEQQELESGHILSPDQDHEQLELAAVQLTSAQLDGHAQQQLSIEEFQQQIQEALNKQNVLMVPSQSQTLHHLPSLSSMSVLPGNNHLGQVHNGPI